MNRGTLFIISGPSGTGKGTVCGELIRRGDVFLSVSMTTRDMRANEIDGVTYNFTDTEAFKKKIADGEMLEWAQYNGNYYGTPKETVEKMLRGGKSVILEIEPQGAFKVRELMPEAVLIFIIPPSMRTLRGRLVSRGRETPEQIASRLEAAKWEFLQADRYDYIVENDDLTKCVSEIAEIMDTVTQKRNKVYSLLEEAEEI